MIISHDINDYPGLHIQASLAIATVWGVRSWKLSVNRSNGRAGKMGLIFGFFTCLKGQIPRLLGKHCDKHHRRPIVWLRKLIGQIGLVLAFSQWGWKVVKLALARGSVRSPWWQWASLRNKACIPVPILSADCRAGWTPLSGEGTHQRSERHLESGSRRMPISILRVGKLGV
jgi:hypothetical protein